MLSAGFAGILAILVTTPALQAVDPRPAPVTRKKVALIGHDGASTVSNNGSWLLTAAR